MSVNTRPDGPRNVKSEGLVRFSDADWAECREDRKLITGFVMMFNGGTISWTCRKQTCVSLLIAEPEFVALSKVEGWLKGLLNYFNEHLNNLLENYINVMLSR